MDATTRMSSGVAGREFAEAIDAHQRERVPFFDRLWEYYRNTRRERTALGGDERSAALAQAAGLPRRLRGSRGASGVTSALGIESAAPEVVIENDIAWRVDALNDFAFGKPVRLASTAPDPERRRVIDAILAAVIEASGGAALLQDMGLLGSVHGHVDLVLRWDERLFSGLRGGAGERRALDGARLLRIDLVEARRGVALLDHGDFRVIRGYAILAGDGDDRRPGEFGGSGLRRFAARALGLDAGDGRGASERDAEMLTASRREVRRGGRSERLPNPLGAIPVVHIQNASQPYRYEGLSDVEPLIPLQDELNTRLSDRAHRVTMQSFNMYLARGLEELGRVPIGPGQVWMTDNPEASIQAFGGDGDSPSEESHIEQVRDAMDKISSVSPVAIGVIRARLGHLSSENALRITLTGILSKTARKRLAYGRGLAAMARLVLHALDVSGDWPSAPDERGVTIEWQDPLPVDERERLNAALLKVQLGVPRERVLAELGYSAVAVPEPTNDRAPEAGADKQLTKEVQRGG